MTAWPCSLLISVDFWSMWVLPFSSTVFPPSSTLLPTNRRRNRALVWERAVERVAHSCSAFLTLPVWARREQQIIEADKLRNAALRGNGVLVRCSFQNAFSLLLLLLLNIDTSLSPPSVSLYTKPAEQRSSYCNGLTQGPWASPIRQSSHLLLALLPFVLHLYFSNEMLNSRKVTTAQRDAGTTISSVTAATI